MSIHFFNKYTYTKLLPNYTFNLNIMIITSLYTYIAILIRKKIPIEKWFFPAFLIGLLIPDLDTIIIYLNFLNINNHTFGHSIISVLIIYLLLLIIYEIYKDKKEGPDIAQDVTVQVSPKGLEVLQKVMQKQNEKPKMDHWL